MSSDGDFLSRWSRRKQAAEEAEKVPGTSDQKQKEVTANQKDMAQTLGEEPAFDITKLPPIDSITAISDIRDFLRAGVPADLSRAALRRAWTLDPAIRDFVGLAEYAWDFTDPDAMPGFGPLEASADVKRMLEQILSRIGEGTTFSAEDELRKPPQAPGASTDFASTPKGSVEQCGKESSADAGSASAEFSQAEKSDDNKINSQVDVAMHHQDVEVLKERRERRAILRRTHGTALPR